MLSRHICPCLCHSLHGTEALQDNSCLPIDQVKSTQVHSHVTFMRQTPWAGCRPAKQGVCCRHIATLYGLLHKHHHITSLNDNPCQALDDMGSHSCGLMVSSSFRTKVTAEMLPYHSFSGSPFTA